MLRTFSIAVFAVAVAACGAKQDAPPKGDDPVVTPDPSTGGQPGDVCESSECKDPKPLMHQRCPDGESTAGATGRCVRAADGQCAWEMTECPAAPPPQAGKPCVRTGCSSTVCVEEGNEVVTTCIYKPEYDCYREAACERQASGECGWTETATLRECIAKAQGK